MKKIRQIAWREFVATVSTKAFIIGLLFMPALILVGITVGPRLFNQRNFRVQGEVAIVDPTGLVIPELRTTLENRKTVARRLDAARDTLAQAPGSVREIAASQIAQAPAPDLRLVERPPDADVRQEKKWLITDQKDEKDVKRLALVVIHPDAVSRAEGKPAYGSYDIYVPPNLDDRTDNEIQQSLRDAIINARVSARALDRDTINAIVRLPRMQSVTVSKDTERQTVGGFNVALPIAFSVLLFLGVMTGGMSLVTSTVEEKSSRVIEVLLSAVSPMELMAGKLLGQLAVSMLTMGLYVAMGVAALASFALFGLLNPWLILYLLIFFLLTYLVFGSLLMAIGSAVNEMREAQSLMMPIIMLLVIPYMLGFSISRDPNSTFSTVISFVPPINGFAMLLRMASSAPPPWWQVWLSIGIGVASVCAAVWFTAKVFRIGLLMYGKAPDFATLIRWARAA
jgi:ABC-2 type transport system permease protein